MEADSPSLLEPLIGSVSDPERSAEAASRLGEKGQGELVSQVARLSRLVDRFFVRIFTQGLDGALRRALEGLSSALEELHDALVSSRLWASDKESLALRLVSSVVGDVEEEIERLMSSCGSGAEDIVRRVEVARAKLEGASGFLREVSAIGPPTSPRDVVALVRRFIPGKEELASYLVVAGHLKSLYKKRGFHKLLAELVSSWFLRSRRASRGCVRPEDIRAWAADVLRMELTPRDVRKALDVLRERGDILKAASEKELVVLRPREEDAQRAFELARKRYREAGSGVSAQLLSQRFGWCIEYASALLAELVRRGWLFPGPSQLIPGAEEYYPPPEDEEP